VFAELDTQDPLEEAQIQQILLAERRVDSE